MGLCNLIIVNSRPEIEIRFRVFRANHVHGDRIMSRGLLGGFSFHTAVDVLDVPTEHLSSSTRTAVRNVTVR